jgi:hypothetical protein
MEKFGKKEGNAKSEQIPTFRTMEAREVGHPFSLVILGGFKK